ncbi:hypothetical protein FACS1894193_07350 [Bacilli bacterium]|nr:hypothetical protein FACS1894193_07350 [Bacilli bacterium]
MVMDLVTRLRLEREGKVHGGIYDITQKRFAYNSNRIEGSSLTEEQTNFIYDTKSIYTLGDQSVKLDDLLETSNHFRCFDYILDTHDTDLSESYIRALHGLLKRNTTSETNPLTPVGGYKVLDNEVGRISTSQVFQVEEDMLSLLIGYNFSKEKNLEQLTKFHIRFEQIHPFADGNGRIGRLLLFKECLKNNIMPFIVDDDHKRQYYVALEKAQVEDDSSLLVEYFESEQKFYKNYLYNKGFEGEIKTPKNKFEQRLEIAQKEQQEQRKQLSSIKETPEQTKGRSL